MSDEWSETEGDPWRVSFRPSAGDRLVLLSIGEDFAIALPPLSAHKLGSALHAASGLDAGPPLFDADALRFAATEPCASCIYDHPSGSPCPPTAGAQVPEVPDVDS